MQMSARKGMVYVLKSMQKNDKIAEAQKLGCWQLSVVATKQRGFKRGGLAKDCAQVVLEAMRTFVLDADMQVRRTNLTNDARARPQQETDFLYAIAQAKGCLVLGWCFYKHIGVAREMQRQGAGDVIKTACKNFSANVAVNSNAQWALANLYPRDSGGDDADVSTKK